MLPWLGERVGNPSSVHRFGREAREAVETARDQVAALIGAQPLEIVFTASGTEAGNAVVASCGAHSSDRTPHVSLSAFEHPAIREAVARLEESGGTASHVSPTSSGVVDVSAFVDSLREETVLACLMLANNELGTVQPVAETAAVCRERSVPFLCDAVQAAGKIPVNVDDLNVDFLILGGHKFHGPLGAAALWVRSGQEFEPLLIGGGQERNRRAGTSDVPAIVGLGVACATAAEELEERARNLGALRDHFEAGLGEIDDVSVHCVDSPRLPNTSHVAFGGIDADSLVIRADLRGYAISTGSACSSGATEISATLAALGLDASEAHGSLRVSFGMMNTLDDVDGLLEVLAQEVAEMRRLEASA